jgi:hypothetical protein
MSTSGRSGAFSPSDVGVPPEVSTSQTVPCGRSGEQVDRQTRRPERQPVAGRPAPHKPLLPLSILNGLDEGEPLPELLTHTRTRLPVPDARGCGFRKPRGHRRLPRAAGQFARAAVNAGANLTTVPFHLPAARLYYPHNLTRRGAARLARQAHNLEVVGSNPTAATPFDGWSALEMVGEQRLPPIKRPGNGGESWGVAYHVGMFLVCPTSPEPPQKPTETPSHSAGCFAFPLLACVALFADAR